MIFHELPDGWIGPFGDNETEHVSTIEDPGKYRFAIDEDKVEANLGAISYNTRRTNEESAGVHDEWVTAGGQLSPAGGAYAVAVRRHNEPEVQNVLHANRDRIFVHAPIVGVGQDTVVSANGRFRLHVQDDGNLVLYDDVQGNVLWASNTNIA